MDRCLSFVSAVLICFAIIGGTMCTIELTSPTLTNRGYLITIPGVMLKNATTPVCVTFKHVTDDVIIEFTWSHNNQGTIGVQREHFTAGTERCVALWVPLEIRHKRVLLTSQVTFFGESQPQVETNSTVVYIMQRNTMLFAQTDKPVYEPGQTVRARVISLDLKLRPKLGMIDKIWVEDPNGFKIKEWISQPTNHGMAEVQFELINRPTMGQWHLISVSEGTRESIKFTVETYELPRFEVSVETDSHVVEEQNTLNVEICSRYTYNKNVTGNYSLIACDQLQTCHTYTGTVVGCTSVLLPSAIWTRDDVNVTKLMLNATVTDIHSGKNHTSLQTDVFVTKMRINVDIESFVPNYYKPNHEFYGKLIGHFYDGRPASYINLFISLYRESITSSSPVLVMSKRVVLDVMGISTFNLMIPPVVVGNVTMKVNLNQRKMLATKQLQQWYSNGESFLQILPVPKLRKCATSLQSELIITQQGRNVETSVDIHYKIFSNGNITASGKHREVLSNSTDPRVSRIEGRIFSLSDFSNRPMMTLSDNIDPVPFNGYLTEFGVTWYHPGRGVQIYLQVWRPRLGSSDYDYIGHKNIVVQSTGDSVVALEGRERIEVKRGDRIVSFVIASHMRGSEICRSRQNSSYYRSTARFLPNTIRFTSLRRGGRPCFYFDAYAKVQYSGREHRLSLDISSDIPFTPLTSLIMYYVTASGETVVDTQNLDVDICLPNQVSMRFNQAVLYPGEPAQISIQSEPGSMCMLNVVDQSVQLVRHRGGTANHVTEDRIQRTANVRLKKHLPSKRICVNVDSQYLADSLQALQDQGLVVLTNMYVDNRPCKPEVRETSKPTTENKGEDQLLSIEHPMVSQEHMMVAEIQPENDVTDDSVENAIDDEDLELEEQFIQNIQGIPYVDRRFYFPETWLWDTVMIDSTGILSLNETVPHTMTQWTGETTCLHHQHGVGVAPTASIASFQPFFVEISVPPVVQLYERLMLRVTVHSHLSDCIQVFLEMPSYIGLALPEGELGKTVCICSKESKTVTHPFDVVMLGDVNITLIAKSISDQVICPNANTDIQARDSVTRTIRVKAQGLHQEVTKSSFVCAHGTDDEEHFVNTTLPSDVVEDSTAMHVTVIADVMGPTLAGVHSLIRPVDESADAVVSSLATNIAVMDYLIEHNMINKTEYTTAKYYATQAYQQHLTYRSEDGSYRLWKNARRGSCFWLTAFVIKTLSHAQQHIYVNEEDLEDSKQWLWGRQSGSGCFYSDNSCDHQMLDGLVNTSGGSTALTAYVAVAMIRSGVPTQDSRVVQTYRCLRNRHRFVNNALGSALLAHAYSEHGNMNDIAQEVVGNDYITESLVTQGEHQYYHLESSALTSGMSSRAADIELTSYILYTLLDNEASGDLHQCSRMVRWLTAQRNSRGGFKSTQDTVITVEALAKYARVIPNNAVSLSVRFPMVLGETEDHHNIEITHNNHHIVNTREIQITANSAHSDMTVVVSGTGCVLLQSVLEYHTPEIPVNDPHFNMHITVSGIPFQDQCPLEFQCWRRKLQVCVSYIGNASTSGHAVLELEMVSGWQTELDSVNDTYFSSHQLEQAIHWFTFDTIYRDETCFDFAIEQLDIILNAKPAYAHLYYGYGKDDTSQRIIDYDVQEHNVENEDDCYCL